MPQPEPFAHRQGAAKAAKHIAGRLLWLQQYLREGVLEVRPVPTAFNLGDIGAKVLSKQRLLALSFMHDFVEGDVHRPVGEQEYDDLLTTENMKKAVKQVKSRVKLGLNLQAAVMISMMSMVDGAAVDSRGSNHNFMFSGRMVMVAMLLAWALGVATQTASSLNWNSLGEMVMTIVALLVALCEAVSKTASLQLPVMMLVGLVYHMYQKVEKKIDEPTIGMTSVSEASVSCRVSTESRGVQCELEASVEIQVHTRYITEPPPKYVNITNHGEAYHKADCKFLRDTTSKQYRRCGCCVDGK